MKYALAIGTILILGAAMSLSLVWPEIRRWRRNRAWRRWQVHSEPKPDSRDWQGAFRKQVKP